MEKVGEDLNFLVMLTIISMLGENVTGNITKNNAGGVFLRPLIRAGFAKNISSLWAPMYSIVHHKRKEKERKEDGKVYE